MSVKCPYCGSTAQPKETGVFYEEDGWEITVTRLYSCGCGGSFSGISVYQCREAYEVIKPINQGGG